MELNTQYNLGDRIDLSARIWSQMEPCPHGNFHEIHKKWWESKWCERGRENMRNHLGPEANLSGWVSEKASFQGWGLLSLEVAYWADAQDIESDKLHAFLQSLCWPLVTRSFSLSFAKLSNLLPLLGFCRGLTSTVSRNKLQEKTKRFSCLWSLGTSFSVYLKENQ